MSQVQPLVSILIPVYNNQEDIVESVSAALAQTYPHVEVIVLDDGSTDGSAELVQATFGSKVRLLRLAHGGLPTALNIGIRAAKGIYISVNDSDDAAIPEKVEKQLGFLQKFPAAVMVGSLAITRDVVTGNAFLNLVPSDYSEICRILPWRNAFVHSTVLYRKDVVTDLGMYKPHCLIMQDYDLWLRLCSRHVAVNIPEVLVYRKMRLTAHTRVRRSRNYAQLCQIRTSNLATPYRMKLVFSALYAGGCIAFPFSGRWLAQPCHLSSSATDAQDATEWFVRLVCIGQRLRG